MQTCSRMHKLSLKVDVVSFPSTVNAINISLPWNLVLEAFNSGKYDNEQLTVTH